MKTRKSNGKLRTLLDVVQRYIASAPNLRSTKRLLYQVNCWGRHAPLRLPITAADVDKFRTSSLAVKLKPRTIETTISSVLTILRGTGQEIPHVGRRLKRGAPDTTQPTVEEIGKLYRAAAHAQWPTETRRLDAAGKRRIKVWRQSERTRFVRAIIFLNFWTGLRIGDLRRLNWSAVHPDRIEWQASKTGAVHVFPVTEEVERHLGFVRKLDREIVLPIADGSVRFLRAELARLSKLAKIGRITPKMFRRASITTWFCSDQPKAGDIIHGNALTGDITRFYIQPLAILKRAAETFHLPSEMLAPGQRSQLERAIKDLLRVVTRRLKAPDDIRRLTRMADAL